MVHSGVVQGPVSRQGCCDHSVRLPGPPRPAPPMRLRGLSHLAGAASRARRARQGRHGTWGTPRCSAERLAGQDPLIANRRAVPLFPRTGCLNSGTTRHILKRRTCRGPVVVEQPYDRTTVCSAGTAMRTDVPTSTLRTRDRGGRPYKGSKRRIPRYHSELFVFSFRPSGSCYLFSALPFRSIG